MGDVLYIIVVATFLAMMAGSVLLWDRRAATGGTRAVAGAETPGSRSPGSAAGWSA